MKISKKQVYLKTNNLLKTQSMFTKNKIFESKEILNTHSLFKNQNNSST